MIYLEDTNRKVIENATLMDIQKAFNNLYVLIKATDSVPAKSNYISLMNDSELALEIYQKTVVLQDYGRFSYDGPGGPGEIVRVRVEEGGLFSKLEEAIDLLDNDEVEKLVNVLKSLPKPE